MKIRNLAAAVAIAAPVALAAQAQMASAAPAPPTGCGTVFCVKVIAKNGNVATIYASDNVAFYGLFQLHTPNQKIINSPTQQWYPNDGYTFSNIDGGVGGWCVTAFTDSGGIYHSDGTECVEA